jgi:asparagine N-glycosylation enzyme membrane subunit Stt3
MILGVLSLVLALAYYLRQRGLGFARATGLAALLPPLFIVFYAFVYPADQELREVWDVAVLAGVFFGLVVGGFGAYVASLFQPPEP